MAIPSDRAKAPAIVIPTLSDIAPASTTPTAIPSGILCSVTARKSMVERPRPVFIPSGSAESRCRCGTSVSKTRSENIPARKPTTAGNHATPPLSAVISIEGMRSDHTDAAIITPDAKPSSSFCTHADIPSRSRKTIAAPRVVPTKGSSRPYITSLCIIYRNSSR